MDKVIVMMGITFFSLFMTIFVVSNDEEPVFVATFSFILGVCMSASVYLLLNH